MMTDTISDNNMNACSTIRLLVNSFVLRMLKNFKNTVIFILINF